MVYYHKAVGRSGLSEDRWGCPREVARRNDVEVAHCTDVASAVHGESAGHHMGCLVAVLCRSLNPLEVWLVLIGAMRCLDGCALTLTLTMTPKRGQPEGTSPRARCTEIRQLDHLEEHEKSSDSHYDKELLNLPPPDSMTKCHGLRHCVVHPSHAVAASLASATESDSVTAHGETSGQENNRVVGVTGRVPYEEAFRDKRGDSALRTTGEQHESFQRLVIEYQGQPAQVYLDVSEVKSVEK